MRSKSEKVFFFFFLLDYRKQELRLPNWFLKPRLSWDGEMAKYLQFLPSGLTKAPGSESAEKDPLASETHTHSHTHGYTLLLTLIGFHTYTHTSHTHEEWQDGQ